MDPSKQFLSETEVELTLKKAAGPNATLKSFKVLPLVASKLGYMGEYFTIQVEYSEARFDFQMTTCRKTFFMKSVPDNIRQFIIKYGLFATECDMYEKHVPMMCQALRISKLSSVPDCYVVCDNNFLIFEDLNQGGFKLHNKFEYLNLDHCKALIKALAQLHAGSIAIEAKTGKTMAFHIKNHRKEDLIKNQTPATKVTNVQQASLATTIALLQKIEQFGPRVAKVSQEVLHKKVEEAWEKRVEIEAGCSAKFANVLSHGDLWINNMMFKQINGKVKAILLDFQTYKYAPAILDVLSFLHLTTSRKLRQNHQAELLQFYHSTMVKILQKAELDSKLAPSLDELEKSATELKIYGVSIAAKYMPTVLKQEMTPEKAMQSCTKKSGIMPPEFLGESSDLVMKGCARSAAMRDRIIETLEELLDLLEL